MEIVFASVIAFVGIAFGLFLGVIAIQLADDFLGGAISYRLRKKMNKER